MRGCTRGAKPCSSNSRPQWTASHQARRLSPTQRPTLSPARGNRAITIRQNAVASRRSQLTHFCGGEQWSEHFASSPNWFQHRLYSVRSPFCRLLAAVWFRQTSCQRLRSGDLLILPLFFNALSAPRKRCCHSSPLPCPFSCGQGIESSHN